MKKQLGAILAVAVLMLSSAVGAMASNINMNDSGDGYFDIMAISMDTVGASFDGTGGVYVPPSGWNADINTPEFISYSGPVVNNISWKFGVNASTPFDVSLFLVNTSLNSVIGYTMKYNSGGDWLGYATMTDAASAYQVALAANSPVPEPATMFLFSTGLIGLAGFSRKKKAQA